MLALHSENPHALEFLHRKVCNNNANEPQQQLQNYNMDITIIMLLRLQLFP